MMQRFPKPSFLRSGARAGGAVVWLWTFAALAAAIAIALVAWRLGPERNPSNGPKGSFVDITQQAGIRFSHNNGASGDNLLPESMGSGVAFLDFDNDGHQDLLFVNSTYWPWEAESAQRFSTLALYRNDGFGSFEDATASAGLDVSLYGMGVAVGDFDNDGWVDVFITTVGRNHLYRNQGDGRFEEVTAEAGVAGAENEWSASAAWVDVNNDGLLDLFVCNYVRWPRELELELAFKLAGIGRGYGPQVNFTPTHPYLYINNGDGTFRESAESFGLHIRDSGTNEPLARSLAVAPMDLDGDGWIDLVVANHRMENFVFRNLGGSAFEETAFTGAASPTGADQARVNLIGIDVARVVGDSPLSRALGSFANDFVGLDGAADTFLFAEEALREDSIASAALQRFGLFFFDFDLDGRLDLFSVNGYLEDDINRIDEGADFRRPASLYWNTGDTDNRFAPVSIDGVGPDLFRPLVGRGAAYADIDGNGTLDVVMTQNGGPPLLLRNDSGRDRNWIRLKLVGIRSNRDAIGATIEATVANRVLVRHVMPTRSYLSQSELPVTIGLGASRRPRELLVIWPDGSRQRVLNPTLNGVTVVTQE